jgi:uncharacterized linocin/CFP29 family protein
MDYILNGQGAGDVASKLMACNMDPNVLRPYSVNGKSYITTIKNGKPTPVFVGNADSTLRVDEWKRLDEAVVKAGQPRLKAVADLRSRGLVYDIPNGMGTTVLQTEAQSDINSAKVSMDGVDTADNDRPLYSTVNLPLPIIHKEFSFSARQIMVSRNTGTPLDTTMVELASRKVAEEAEKLLIGNSASYDQYTFGGGTIYGYTDYTYRNTKTMTAPTASGWTASDFIEEILDMRKSSQDDYYYGPWMLYVSPDWDQYLDDDYKTALADTLRERVARINGIMGIRTLDYLTGYQAILVQMTPDVVREVIGMDLTTVEWESRGGMMKHFKVMAIMVPQIRADYNSNCGIVHGSTS